MARTCHKYCDEIDQIYLPLIGLIGWMPEGYQAGDGDSAERYARASNDPPPEQRHPTHHKSSESLVGSWCDDVGEMVLSLQSFQRFIQRKYNFEK